jgi:hypothetical protein
MTSDLWVITCYFNPCRYTTKRENYDAFMAGMHETGASVLTVELAFGGDEFELHPSAAVLRLRGTGTMWQKERLLNVAAASLPASCRKVAWLDCDVLFENADWVCQTSEALEASVVVQPFDTAVRLARGQRTFDGQGRASNSFAHTFVTAPRVAQTREYTQHGSTGFAWAARRELFEFCGLYDACLTGTGDHFMAHAFAARMRLSPCLQRVFASQPRFAHHFAAWGTNARDLVDGRLGVVPGRLLHLWHGDVADRRYSKLNVEFRRFDFDPERDLRLDENGLWEWSEAPQELRHWASEMFRLRKEDGDPAGPSQDHEAPA